MSRALVILRGDDVELVTTWDAAFVADLKSHIPAECRTYDPETKAWTVRRAGCFNVAMELVQRYYRRIEHLDGRYGPLPPKPEHSPAECLAVVRGTYPAYATLGLLPDVPRALVAAAYRTWSRLCHPDTVGPSGHAAMVRLNRAYASLTER